MTSGIPQGSMLGPTLFVLFINDLSQVVESPVALFVDDTNVFREIQSDENRQKLQQDIWVIFFNMATIQEETTMEKNHEKGTFVNCHEHVQMF